VAGRVHRWLCDPLRLRAGYHELEALRETLDALDHEYSPLPAEPGLCAAVQMLQTLGDEMAARDVIIEREMESMGICTDGPDSSSIGRL
jgi:AcrR family transcriptional regulator